MFIKKKIVKNKDGSERTYLQLVESRRINGQPRQVVLLNLGKQGESADQSRIDLIAETMLSAAKNLKLLNLSKDLAADWSHEYGPLLVFRELWQELGLEKVIRGEMQEYDTEFDIVGAIFNMTLNRLSEPCSKRQMECWQESIYELAPYAEQHYYRALDYLIEHKDDIEKRLFNRMRDLFHQKVDILLFDTTTIAYYGEGAKGEKLLAHGFSKIKRSDLKQIVVGVIMTSDGIPIGHEVFAGNQNDVTCFKEVIDKIAKKFQIGRVVLVGDRGMISKKNIEHLKGLGYEYVLGYRMRTIPQEERQTVLAKANLKVLKKETLHWKEVNYDDQRLIVCFNPERADLDAKKREEILERIRDKIKSGSITALISNADYKKFLKIKGQAPVVDEEKVKRDALYDGIFVLTSNTKLSGGAVIEAYKDLWQIEAGFRQLKTELEAGPIYHWKDRRIRAHIMICFLALVMRTAFNKRLKVQDPEASYRKVLADTKALHAIGLTIAGEKHVVRTELKPGANIAFRAMGMRPPNRILFSQLEKNVVVRL